MLPPTLASKGGRGLSLSFLKPLRFGLRALATEGRTELVSLGKRTDSQELTGKLGDANESR